MDNTHTQGFYILEDYRCKNAYNAMRLFAQNDPIISDYCVNITFDRINVIQNLNTYTETEISQAESVAYNTKKKTKNFFQKIAEKLR